MEGYFRVPWFFLDCQEAAGRHCSQFFWACWIATKRRDTSKREGYFRGPWFFLDGQEAAGCHGSQFLGLLDSHEAAGVISLSAKKKIP